MPFDVPQVELSGIAPELALSAMALLVLLVHAFVRRPGVYLPALATVGLAAAIVLAARAWGTSESQLSGMIAADRFAVFVKVVVAVFGLLAVWLARGALVRSGIEEPEFYALILFAVAGMMLMAAASDLIVIFLALETFSLAIYVLVGFRRRSPTAQEGAMKYFLLGTFSSAFFLLGIALVYGATGTTTLGGDAGVMGALSSAPASELGLLVLGTGLLVVGLGFKIAAVPFHMWTPDAYQGAPTPVTGFMAAATKVAAFAAILRVFDLTLFSLRWDWRPLMTGIAIATMVVGSVLAVVQEDLKRLLAYSSIAHAGFLLTGVIAASDRGVAGTLFYLATYGLSVLGAFAVVSILSGPEERRVRLIDYKGLFYENPLLGGALTLFLLSLAGVPITSGFVGKLLVFGAAVDAGYAWLVVVGVIASAIAAFFYLRVMVVMYMQESEGRFAEPPPDLLAYGVVGLTAAATIVFGLFWSPLIRLAEDATFFVGG